MDKIHVYTVVWNEKYMMPYFLRHYASLVERIFVLDDLSDDGTRVIVEACSKATLLPYPYPGGLDDGEKAKAFSEVYKEHSRGKAEWVICVDCDEFVYHEDLRGFLDAMRKQGRRAIKTTGELRASRKTPDTARQLYDAMPYKRGSRKYNKAVVFDPTLDVLFNRGMHHPTFFSEGVVAGQCGLRLIHCCYLSEDWIKDHLQRRYKRLKTPFFDLRIATLGALQLYRRMINGS